MISAHSASTRSARMGAKANFEVPKHRQRSCAGDVMHAVTAATVICRL